MKQSVRRRSNQQCKIVFRNSI